MRVCLSLLISIFAAHLQHAHADGLFNNGLHFEEVSFSAFIITPPLALAIATMGTANAFGLFLLAPITDVLSHWCLGATPGVFITFGNVKIDFASVSVVFWAAGTCQDGVLFMSNSIILGAMYLFLLMVLFIVVCISDLVLVCLCMQN